MLGGSSSSSPSLSSPLSTSEVDNSTYVKGNNCLTSPSFSVTVLERDNSACVKKNN
jgi:hypothetical protein